MPKLSSRKPQNVNNAILADRADIKTKILKCANNLHVLKNLSSSLQGLKRNQNSWEVGGYTLLRLKEAYQTNAELTKKELVYFAYLLSWNLIEKMGNQPTESIIEDERLLTALVSENRLKANQPKWVKTKLTSILANIQTLTEQTRPWRDNPQGNQEMMPEANWLTKKRLSLCAMRLIKEYGVKKPGVFRKTHAEIMASLSEAKLDKKRARVKWYDKRFIVFRWLFRLVINFEKDRAYCVYEDTKKLIDTLKNNPSLLHENNAFNTKLQSIQTQSPKLSTFSRLNPTMKDITSVMNELPLNAYVAESQIAQQANIPNPPEEIAHAPEVELTLEALEYIVKCRAFINECHLMISSYYEALIEKKPSNLIQGKYGSNIALTQKDFFEKNEEALRAWKDKVLNPQLNEQKKVLAKKFRDLSPELHPDKEASRKIEIPDGTRAVLWNDISTAWATLNAQLKLIELPDMSDFDDAIEFISKSYFATTDSSIDENSLFFKYIFKEGEFNYEYNNNVANVSQSREALEDAQINEGLAQTQRRIEEARNGEAEARRREAEARRGEEEARRGEEEAQRRIEEAQRREAEAQRELIELQQKANIKVASSNLDIGKNEAHEPRRSFQM